MAGPRYSAIIPYPCREYMFKGTSKNALFPRQRRQLRARFLMYCYTLRFCTRCFLALAKKSLFLEVPLIGRDIPGVTPTFPTLPRNGTTHAIREYLSPRWGVHLSLFDFADFIQCLFLPVIHKLEHRLVSACRQILQKFEAFFAHFDFSFDSA